jgi:hypothetical protein
MIEQEFIPDFDETSLAIREDSVEPVPTEQLLQTFGVDVDKQVQMLKKVVELAPQIIKYRAIIIKNFTYPQDWVKFGSGDKAKACLSNHAVMRIVDKANFPIRFSNIRGYKEDIRDKDNNLIGYRYLYEGYGEMGERNVFAIGQYSTRDAFLGKANHEWRDFREINESYIRQAAHSFFKGNVVKDLLGLKSLPWEEFEKLSTFAGQVAEKAPAVEFREGGQGGTSEVDRTTQNSLFDMLRDLGGQGLVVRWRESEDVNGKKVVEQYIGDPTQKTMEYFNNEPTAENLAVVSLKSLQTWFNSEGKLIHGTGNFDKVSGKQLKMLTGTKIPKMIKDFENA